MKKFYQLIVCLTVILSCNISLAQFQLVKDINTGTVTVGSSPRSGLEINGVLYFTAINEMGYELWKTDGTSAGTSMVKDINVGRNSSAISNLTNVNGTLYFTAIDAENNIELWKSNGTASGTLMVKDINPGIQASNPLNLTNANGTLYFTATDGKKGRELWKSDGTSSGTVMVKDILPGENSSDPQYLVNLNGILYFSAADGLNGTELWKSDGTEAGTVMVKDIFTGANNSTPQFLTAMNDLLYFSAKDGINGTELWKSDGSASGTVMVKDIYPGGADANPTFLININNRLFFAADDGMVGNELWKSDGTPAGTVLVKDITQSSFDIPSGSTGFIQLLNLNGILLFFKAGSSQFSYELWKTDGTEPGTSMIKDVGGDYRFTNSLLTVNTVAYFSSRGVNGYELWKTDGTVGGTSFVKDIYTGATASFPRSFSKLSGFLLFSANDAVAGEELWKSDGTESGTVLVKDIYTVNASSRPAYLTALNNQLYFVANDDVRGQELWRSDGTEAGTSIVKDVCAGAASGIGYFGERTFTTVGNTIFFQGLNSCGNNDYELWKSDGTEAGTVMVKDINPGPGTSIPQLMTNVNGILYFSARTEQSGLELWKSDGTDAGTLMVKELTPGSNGSAISDLTNVNGTLFFRAITPDNANALYKSDGTAAGTVLLKASVYPTSLTNVNGTLYFNGYSTTTGLELWKSDGTAAGTVMVKDIYPGAGPLFSGTGSSNPKALTNINGTLYFVASTADNGKELWKSDGTEAGTVMIKDIFPGTTGSEPLYLTNLNGTLYFSAKDSTHGRELWKSDGTASGTIRFDLRTGEAGSNPANLKALGNQLLFSCNDGVSGDELWITDGTIPGTNLLQDISPGTAGSIPQTVLFPNTGSINIAEVGDKIFITPDVHVYGAELWVGQISVVLPVTLISFAGKLQGDKIILQWTVENELNFDSYEIERSINGNSFNKIGEIKAANAKQYSYNDNTNELKDFKVYYRLRMVDKDGKVTYSSVVPVTVPSDITFNIYPNPASSQFQLQFNKRLNGKADIQIIDVAGKVVMRKTSDLNASVITLSTNKLSPGTYSVKMIYNNEQYLRKIIIVK